MAPFTLVLLICASLLSASQGQQRNGSTGAFLQELPLRALIATPVELLSNQTTVSVSGRQALTVRAALRCTPR